MKKNYDHVVTIDPAKHAKWRVKQDAVFSHAKELNLAAVTLGELPACVANFPIVFVRHPETGVMRPVAMFGLRPGENEYYNASGWDSTSVPMMLQRYPFLIGYDDRDPDAKDLTTCIDKNSPLLSDTDGIALFDASGKPTDFLSVMSRLLGDIFEGERVTERFTKKMQEYELLAPFELILQAEDGQAHKITGLWTLDEKKLRELAPERVQELQSQDFLPAAHMIFGSLFQVHRLMMLRNRKHVDKLNYRIELNPQTA